MVSNTLYNNVASPTFPGLDAGTGQDNVYISNFSYGNGSGLLTYLGSSTQPNIFAGGGFGYDANLNSVPNTTDLNIQAEAQQKNLILRDVYLKQSGIVAAGFDTAFGYMLNYSTAPGVVQVWGDYVVTGTTFTVDYASQLFGSSATHLKVTRGTGSTFTVNSTSDTTAVNQLITITWDGSAWQVVGSSTGNMGSYTGTGVSRPFPSSNTQFLLTINYTTPAIGDFADFALLAASQDQFVQKQLLFGKTGSGLNRGRSKLAIDATGGFRAVGVSTAPTLIDWIDSNSTYYVFVDTGALTLGYATVNHGGEHGLELSGTANGVNISTITFDYSGSVVSSGISSYLTTRSLASNTTMYNVVFNSSWSSGTAANYNVWASTQTNLYWVFKYWNGGRGGENFDREDPSVNKVVWNSTGAVCGSTITSVANGNWSSLSTWDISAVPTLCTPVSIAGGTTVTVDISSAAASTITVTGMLQFGTVANSSLTVTGGNVYVNPGGWLALGTPANPIPAGSTATLTLAYGNIAGAYGLTVQPGGNFTVVGTTRTPYTTATANVSRGATSINVNTPVTGWSKDDVITVDTEAVTITSIVGGAINFTPSLGIPHASSSPIMVANLSRNAVVRSSGTSIPSGAGTNGGNSSAYIRNLTTVTTALL